MSLKTKINNASVSVHLFSTVLLQFMLVLLAVALLNEIGLSASTILQGLKNSGHEKLLLLLINQYYGTYSTLPKSTLGWH